MGIMSIVWPTTSQGVWCALGACQVGASSTFPNRDFDVSLVPTQDAGFPKSSHRSSHRRHAGLQKVYC